MLMYLCRVDCIVCIDACFTQKRSNNLCGSEGADPPNITSTVFICKDEVDKVEAMVDGLCPRWGGHAAEEKGFDGDNMEKGMSIPISVLDACGDAFIAADEKREKVSTRFFTDTGLMAMLCHHDCVLWLVNMTSAGERQHYAITLICELIKNIPDDMRVGLLYDIGCQLECSCHKYHLLDESILNRIQFGISVFHAYGHQWACQIIYHPRKREGFGLSDGEGCERLWSALKHLIPSLRVSGVGDF
jgi:Kyakuja-Dileera-Zisupton transposase